MIRLLDIQKTYDNGTKALKGVSMRIDDGEFAFLVGPSGSGKSTIIKLITGEVHPSGGRIMVNGYNLNSIRPGQIPYMRRTLGVIFQDFRLIDKKTVWENLTFAMRAVGASPREIRKRIPYVLDLVGLSRKEDRYPTQLSGGEQQRVAIARALGMETKLLFADEPTGNLDTANGENILSILQSLAHQDGYCVILVTHDEGIGRRADQLIYLVDGLLQTGGTAGE